MSLRYGAVSSVLLLLHLRRSAASTDDSAVTPPPIFNLGEEYNPTMALIMVVLVGAFFVLGFFSIYANSCAQRLRGDGSAAAAADGSVVFIGAPRPWRVARGVGAEVVRSFPSFRYSSVKAVKGSLECAVCLNEFVDDETLRLLPKCRHVFHSDCVDAWLSANSTCPVCRADLVPKPGEDLGFAAVQISDPNNGLVEPEINRDGENTVSIAEVNVINKNCPRETNSTKMLYLRSESSSHSRSQIEQDDDQVAPNLLKEVQIEVLDSPLKRTKSLGALLPSERSDYRDRNSDFHYGRFN